VLTHREGSSPSSGTVSILPLGGASPRLSVGIVLFRIWALLRSPTFVTTSQSLKPLAGNDTDTRAALLTGRSRLL